MLYWLAALLLLFWLGGLLLDVVGGLVHVLLVIAVAVVLLGLVRSTWQRST
jgi:hypothetical protein